MYYLSHFLKVYTVSHLDAYVYYVRPSQTLLFHKECQNHFDEKASFLTVFLFFYFIIYGETRQKNVKNIQQSQWRGSHTYEDTCSFCYYTVSRSPVKCILQKNSEKCWQLANTLKYWQRDQYTFIKMHL